MGDPMTNSIKKQIAVLVKLQDLDNQIQRLQSTLNEVAGQLEEIDHQLDHSEKRCLQKKEGLENLRKTYRDKERDVQTLRAQAIKSQEKSSSVKTNKEYQSILKEIDEIKAKASGMEDDMLEILERIDTEENEYAQQQEELSQLKKEIEQQKEGIESEAQAKQKRLQGILADRENVLKEVAPDMLVRFEKVRAKVGILTIAAVKDAVCRGCHVNIPPQLFNELQRYDSILQCPNCQRIIYYNDSQKRSE
jgi:predicted  nucleic acid-binding Zn-ribbon protein